MCAACSSTGRDSPKIPPRDPSLGHRVVLKANRFVPFSEFGVQTRYPATVSAEGRAAVQQAVIWLVHTLVVNLHTCRCDSTTWTGGLWARAFIVHTHTKRQACGSLSVCAPVRDACDICCVCARSSSWVHKNRVQPIATVVAGAAYSTLDPCAQGLTAKNENTAKEVRIVHFVNCMGALKWHTPP